MQFHVRMSNQKIDLHPCCKDNSPVPGKDTFVCAMYKVLGITQTNNNLVANLSIHAQVWLRYLVSVSVRLSTTILALKATRWLCKILRVSALEAFKI